MNLSELILLSKHTPFTNFPCFSIFSQIFRSWMHWKIMHIRFSVLLEQLVYVIGSGRQKLIGQIMVTEKMKQAVKECQNAKKATGGKPEHKKLKILHEVLMDSPPEQQLTQSVRNQSAKAILIQMKIKDSLSAFFSFDQTFEASRYRQNSFYDSVSLIFSIFPLLLF